jgi:hypothetical protein
MLWIFLVYFPLEAGMGLGATGLEAALACVLGFALFAFFGVDAGDFRTWGAGVAAVGGAGGVLIGVGVFGDDDPFEFADVRLGTGLLDPLDACGVGFGGIGTAKRCGATGDFGTAGGEWPASEELERPEFLPLLRVL